MAWLFSNRNDTRIHKRIYMYWYCFVISILAIQTVKCSSTSVVDASQPLLVFLDTHQEASAQKTGAITNYLAYAIIEQSTPIAASGTVFHNFLLLQKKQNDLLDRLRYPTIQALVTAVATSEKKTKQLTADIINYLSQIRQNWYAKIPEPQQTINETRIANSSEAFLSLIPQKPITESINEAEYAIVPVLNHFLEIFQTEAKQFFDTYKSKDAAHLNQLIKSYNKLLSTHAKELDSLKKLLYKNLNLVIEAHNLLTKYVFEYTYRFAECNPRSWDIYFQKDEDLYLLIPHGSPRSGITVESSEKISWGNHASLLKLIQKNTAQAAGIYALYQRSALDPLRSIDSYFFREEGKYKLPLDLFLVGHGAAQETKESFENGLSHKKKRIGVTLDIINQLITLCEHELEEITGNPLKVIVDQLTNNALISPQTYQAVAEETNQRCITLLNKEYKNPLNPDPNDIEYFLEKEFRLLQKTTTDYAFYWLFLTNLLQKYQQALDALSATKQEARDPQEYEPASAHIGGLSISQLQSFISQSIVTDRLNTLYCLTCFGGGSNRLIFETMAKELNHDEDRTVNCAIGALTDAAVPSLIPTLEMFVIKPSGSISFNPPLSFATFAQEKLSPKGLKAITVGQKYRRGNPLNEYFHGVTDLPWKYDPTEKKLKLINLDNKLLDITTEFVAQQSAESKTVITVAEQKVVMLQTQNIPLTITLNPEDQLLPLICSSSTESLAQHSLEKLILPNHTLQELIELSIGHLKQTKRYDLSIDTLECTGITSREEEPLKLTSVRISNAIKSSFNNENQNRPEKNDKVTWNISFELSGQPYEYSCVDSLNHEGNRFFSGLTRS